MSKPRLYNLVFLNETRIKQLEALIPHQERIFNDLHPANCSYYQIKNHLNELKLEYKERTGREYKK